MSTCSSSNNNNSKLLVIVGATGHQGGSVVKHLQQSANNNGAAGQWKLRGLTRDVNSEKAKKLTQQGIEMVSCDLMNLSQVEEAFKGAYGVFALTIPGSFQTDIDHDREYIEGLNQVKAAVKNNVQHFVFSSLDDVSKASNGKISVPHFTNKNRVEQYAREQSTIPFKTFVYPPFYADNLPEMMFKLSEDGKSGTIVAGVNPERKLPIFGVEDLGIVVTQIFNKPNEFNDRKILTAGDYVTFNEMAESCTKILGIPTRYIEMDAETVGQRMGNEMKGMYTYFNELGYYQDDEIEAVKEARSEFPELLTFEQWVTKNRDSFFNDVVLP